MEQEEEGRRGQGKAGKGAALKNPDYQPYNQLAKGIPLLPVCLLLISLATSRKCKLLSLFWIKGTAMEADGTGHSVLDLTDLRVHKILGKRKLGWQVSNGRHSPLN